MDFCTNVLGMPLIKSLDLPDGQGQHFFFDAGNGDCVAFFWFADAPDRVAGVSSPGAIPGIGDITSAVSKSERQVSIVLLPGFRWHHAGIRLLNKGIRGE